MAFFCLGYPHVMPGLRGAALRSMIEAVAAHCPVALDVNEAFDDTSLPLGDAQDAFAAVTLLHGNLDEAAACLNRKHRMLEAAAEKTGQPAFSISLEVGQPACFSHAYSSMCGKLL